MARGEVRQGNSCSIRGDDGRRAVKAVKTRVYQLPEADRRQVGAIQLLRRRSEDHVDALGRAQLQVGFEVARIAVEVLAGAELQRVDEDRHDDEVRAILPRDANQREMTFMEKAHRRNEADHPAGRAGSADGRSRFVDGMDRDQFTFGIGTTTESP